jgi:predicted GIY-YIG superfamily endonuclease
MKGGYVYIMTNKPQGTLYIGVTSNLARRTWEHREGVIDGFTKRYGLRQLAPPKSGAMSVWETKSMLKAVARKRSIRASSSKWLRKRLRRSQRKRTLPMSTTTIKGFVLQEGRAVSGGRATRSACRKR